MCAVPTCKAEAFGVAPCRLQQLGVDISQPISHVFLKWIACGRPGYGHTPYVEVEATDQVNDAEAVAKGSGLFLNLGQFLHPFLPRLLLDAPLGLQIYGSQSGRSADQRAKVLAKRAECAPAGRG